MGPHLSTQPATNANLSTQSVRSGARPVCSTSYKPGTDLSTQSVKTGPDLFTQPVRPETTPVGPDLFTQAVKTGTTPVYSSN